ncbi:secretion system [Micractinium conductrix]|uniref:Secretion system n=1 Tax=Micractinium conductrix TaxID=554055 RepID=A0A2P6VM06_9CHLO|nr:secretion system [Micractinium conductrix]|eukprot:PSC75087.1 secretion system [Micractinium conductrix]
MARSRSHLIRCSLDSSGDKNVSGGGSKNGSGKNGSAGGGGSNNGISLQNYELLIGDCLCLLCFALYKQITAIILLPSFPGWLAPLQFSPTRLLEFVSFSVTLLGTWVASGLLTGGYRFEATANVRAALSRVSAMWLISMPVAAAQLVLLTAAEDVALVGDEGWASALPLAATGPGEPFVTAAGVLGLMAVWRAFYAAYIDIYSFGKLEANSRDRVAEMEHFADSLRGAMLLSLACCAVLQFLGGLVGEEELEVMAASLLGLASASGR